MTSKPDRRFELKVSIEPQQLSQARSWLWLNPAGFRPTFSSRFVNSIYFDTPDLARRIALMLTNAGDPELVTPVVTPDES